MVVDRGDVQAGPHGGPVHLEGAQAVLGQQRHDVARAQAGLVQDMGQLNGALLQLAVGQRLAGLGQDRGQLAGVPAAYLPGYMVLRRGGVSDGVNNLPQT